MIYSESIEFNCMKYVFDKRFIFENTIGLLNHFQIGKILEFVNIP